MAKYVNRQCKSPEFSISYSSSDGDSESEDSSSDFEEDYNYDYKEYEEEEPESAFQFQSHSHQAQETKWKCLEQNCGKSFEYRKSLVNHHRQYHLQDKSLQCSFCEKRFSSKSNLRVHKRLHTGKLPFKCQIEGCVESFRTAHFLKDHMKKYHGTANDEEHEFQCLYCDKKLASERSRRSHMQLLHLKQNKVLCPVCSREFYTSQTFSRHMQRLHTGEKAEQTEKLLDSNKCPCCNKRFLTKLELRDHCLVKHKTFKGFPCPVCDKYFMDTNRLRSHTKSHKDAGDPKFHCAECGSAFKHRSHYKEHLKRHSKSFPFRCPVCPNQGFFRKQKLDIHLNRLHRPTIDLRCERSRQRDKIKHKALMPELYPPKIKMTRGRGL